MAGNSHRPGRLAFAEIAPELQEMLRPTVDRLGYFGDFFGYAANNPEILRGFMGFSGALKMALPDDINEALALSVCDRMGFAYERIQHERLSEKLGFARAWIGVMAGQEDGPVELTALQAATRQLGHALADGLIEQARDAASSIAELGGDDLAIAALFQATRYIQVCLVGRVLDMELPVASIFARDA